MDRVRRLVLDVGEDLAALDHDDPVPAGRHLDQLAWVVDLAEARGALAPADVTEARRAITCARALIPGPRSR